MIVIFVKVLGGSAPNDQDFTLDVFSPPGGIPFSTVAIAAVFGFLSFGGFEGAASLGEETDNPSRNIPRAIFTAVVVAGASTSSAWSPRASASGSTMRASSASASPRRRSATSASDYIGEAFADFINFGATISAFAATLGAATAASRILFAISRDGVRRQPARPRLDPLGRARPARSS